jgi:hypothetical protein
MGSLYIVQKDKKRMMVDLRIVRLRRNVSPIYQPAQRGAVKL